MRPYRIRNLLDLHKYRRLAKRNGWAVPDLKAYDKYLALTTIVPDPDRVIVKKSLPDAQPVVDNYDPQAEPSDWELAGWFYTLLATSTQGGDRYEATYWYEDLGDKREGVEEQLGEYARDEHGIELRYAVLTEQSTETVRDLANKLLELSQ
jgi:hypothetical protein